MTKDPITVEDDLTVEEMISTVTKKVKESSKIRDYKVDKVIIVDKNKEVIDVVDFYELWYKQEAKYRDLCIVGTGHVGLTLQVVLAEAGYQVVGFDIDKEVVNRLNRGEATFYENGVEPLLRFHIRSGNLKFTSDLKSQQADAYIICVGTPVDDETRKPVFDSLKRAAEDIGKVLKKEDIVILRSTVLVGTTREIVLPILEKISSLKAGKDFYLVFAPERVIEGKALEETKEIPQILGGLNPKSTSIATRIFQKINSSIIILDCLEEAEMIKLINNTFRDLSFSFANKVAQISNGLGLDPVKIIKAAKEGYPRNPVPLPSPGVGGYCLTKDPYLMSEVAQKAGVGAGLFLESRKTNDAMPSLIAEKVIRFFASSWKKEEKLKIFIMGFAFKGYPETSDMRGSTTLDILKILKNHLVKRAHFVGFDPVVAEKDIRELGIDFLSYEDGFKDAHAVLLLNNHPDFAKIDVYSLLEKMKKPGLFLDAWYFFLPKEIRRVENIIYEGLGGGY